MSVPKQCRSGVLLPMNNNPYETDELLQQYLLFHYATAEQQFPYAFGGADALGFPRRCVSEGVDLSAVDDGFRALDIGCSVGRSTFELARHGGEVIGIDYSQAFIDAANRLKRDGTHLTNRIDEGSATSLIEVGVDSDIDRDRVHFETGDAQNLRQDLGQFDVVIACNLICRLREPQRLLQRFSELLRPGGQLFITTPFTWLEEYTDQSNWLGDGARDSFEGLRSALESDFELDKQWDMPFLIREHARKFQYSIAQASRWVRR